ncbi:hypothetical protein BP6252_02732 [Coleophoma cylindrospora]|uniref:Phosphoglycerate mutase family protein n=1 Tax=Coleophoma cylindrospora TaxID=1849047 RepID=A0A3D8SFQ1_9HELO|nr:hypothetical protein BP6252_02732 [Coleophoma cylindrospora]
MVAKPIIYLIRHGEKPPKKDGEDVNGLSSEGVKRADYLPQVFGKQSQYNIGYILAEHPKKDGSRARPYETVLPLSKALDLQIDKDISRDDVGDAAKKALAYQGPGNVLICWEHGELAKIAQALGVTGFTGRPDCQVVYPDDRFDLIWTVSEPYTEISQVESEDVPGLDGGAVKDWCVCEEKKKSSA